MRDEVQFVFQAVHSCMVDRLKGVQVNAGAPQERVEQWTGLLWMVGWAGKNPVAPGFQVPKKDGQDAAS